MVIKETISFSMPPKQFRDIILLIIMALGLIWSLSSCEYKFKNDLTWYQIDQGEHKSKNLGKDMFKSIKTSKLGKRDVEFYASFRNGTLYDPQIVGNHWNKLYGMSCDLNHQRYSMRIRTYVAAKALQGLMVQSIAGSHNANTENLNKERAIFAVDMADALIEALANER